MYDWATNVLPHHPIVMLGKECRMTRTQSKWFVPHPMLPWGCLNEKCPTAPVIRVYLMCKLLWGQLIATFCLLIVCQSACYSKVIGGWLLCPGCHWLQMEVENRGGVVLFRRTATGKMWQLIISVKLVSRYLRKAWLGLARKISNLIIVCCKGTWPVTRNCDWKNMTMTDNCSNWFQAVREELPIRGEAAKLPLFPLFLYRDHVGQW